MFRGRLGVTLYVSDISASVDFYRFVLSFAFDGYWNEETGQMSDDWEASGRPTYVEMRAGENLVGLQHVEEVTEQARAEFRVEVIDIEGFHQSVKESGAEPSEITTEGDVWKTFTLYDLNGYGWQFYKQLKFGN